MGKTMEFKLASARSGQLTALARLNGENYKYLHSSIDPQAEAEAWVKRLEITPKSLLVVLGLGLGYHVEALLKAIKKDSHILVIHTPQEMELLRNSEKKRSLKRFLDPRVRFRELTNLHDLGVAVGNTMLDKMVKKISLCKYYPAMALAEADYDIIESELVWQAEKSMSINFNMGMTTSHVFFRNYWSNMPKIIENPGVGDLKGALSDYPVIVVASGPSLNKNIHLLRECQEHGIIIAASTAIGALAKNNIKPDFLVVCESSDKAYHILREYFSPDTRLIIATQGNKDIVENYPGPIAFFQPNLPYYMGMENYLPAVAEIKSSISVTISAVDFAVNCGSKKIILLGQDLAYANDGADYAVGVKGGGYQKQERIKVEGYYGGEVDSNHVFASVIDYFNGYVPQQPSVEFINATEGGALIETMKNMAFHDVMRLVLPSHPIKKGFDFPSNPSKKKSLRKITAAIQKTLVVSQRLAEKVEKFELDIEYLWASGEHELLADKYRDFYKDISVLPGYDYLKSVMRPRFQLLSFSCDEGITKELECKFYQKLTYEFKELIAEFIKLLQKTINLPINLEENQL